MITRPLDLASHLRAEPRRFDFLFLVNAGLLALFFTLFGSRFVLSPGLVLDFQLPTMAGARAGAVPTAVSITVTSTGVILADEGIIGKDQLAGWLKKHGENIRRAALTVNADAKVPLEDLTYITNVAQEAGFFGIVFAAVEPVPPKNGGRR